MSITSSTLIFKIIVPKNIDPCKENKGNRDELLPNEVPKVQAVENHRALLLINQIYTPNKEMNKHLK